MPSLSYACKRMIPYRHCSLPIDAFWLSSTAQPPQTYPLTRPFLIGLSLIGPSLIGLLIDLPLDLPHDLLMIILGACFEDP